MTKSAIPEIKYFGAWNNQKTNPDTEETKPALGVFFEYSEIGDGLEYLLQRDMQQSERVPVEVTLHIMFNNYNDKNQDVAYKYAYLLVCEIVGKKHPLIHGRILKTSETEDSNHRAAYDYQISFGFQLKEAIFIPEDEQSVDANEDDQVKLNISGVIVDP
jgi:hypothetical protein